GAFSVNAIIVFAVRFHGPFTRYAQAMVMNLELNLVLRNSRNIHGNEVMIFPFPDVASRGPFAFTEATRLRLISGAPEIIEKTVEFGTELAQRILARVYGLKLTHKSFPP